VNVLYLLDANVPIRANAEYYPIMRLPQFWDWLVREASAGHVKMPREIYEEITPAKDDPLKDWVEDENVRAAIELDEVIDH